MNIDHIFIFTDDNGQIADELVAFGLTEGSNRIHAGQGTTNRKFYFDNFFLEILWVHDEAEIESELTKSTGLWQRANFKSNHFAPFGLCVVNTDETEQFFERAFKYQPNYFPQGLIIDILKNEHQPDLPWTFRLPFKVQKKNSNEPINHKNGIANLTKAIFEYQNDNDDKYLDYFKNDNNIEFKQSSRNWLNLIFDSNVQQQRRDFEKLQLTIEY